MKLLQGVLIIAVALAIGWRPDASLAAIVTAPVLIVLGTAAFSGLALLVQRPRPANGGHAASRGHLTAGNLVYILLLGVGQRAARAPLAANQPAERAAARRGIPAGIVATPAVWAMAAIALAARTFRWELKSGTVNH